MLNETTPLFRSNESQHLQGIAKKELKNKCSFKYAQIHTLASLLLCFLVKL